eukprot:scaffold3735_cov242-Ochromonas_danica.AAC.2
MTNFLSSVGIPSIRLCDDSDAESIYELSLHPTDVYFTKPKLMSSWNVEKIESDIFEGKYSWYCLEIEQENDENVQDLFLAAARMTFTETKVALVDHLLFATATLDDQSEVIGKLLSLFLRQLESTAFHLSAKQIVVEVTETQTELHHLLEELHYEETSGYLLEESKVTIFCFSKSLHSFSREKKEELADSDCFEIVSQLTEISLEQEKEETEKNILALMPTLFQALHAQYDSSK